MIKEENVLVSVNYRNIKYYLNLGYNIQLSGMVSEKIEVPILHVSKFSMVKITAICDICGVEKTLSILKYFQNFDRGNFYSCFKCKNIKKESTIMKKYGVTSFSKTDEFKEKYKKTSLDRYGVENPNMSKSVRDKTKETCIRKYGYSNPFLNPKVIELNKEWMSSNEFKEKSKITLLDKYGVDSFSKTNEFKNNISENKEIIMSKIKETFLKKYGVDAFSKTKEWKANQISLYDSIEEKKVNSCIKKYGVNNVSKVTLISAKSKETKIKKGLIIPDELLTDWEIYKRNVRSITRKHLRKLYEEWDGIDYYDSEFIKGNFSLVYTNRYYPTVDHKISTLYGFLNKIPHEEIGNISNLCITKRYINSQKSKLIESEFIKKTDLKSVFFKIIIF